MNKSPSEQTNRGNNINIHAFLNNGKPQLNLPRTKITFKTPKQIIVITAQVASTPLQRQKGLMFRKRMEENEGMLFVFEKEDFLSFWMYNTYIPLDMIFLNSQKKIVGIVQGAIPLDTTGVGPRRKAQYVIEVNAGFVRKYNINEDSIVLW